MRYQGSAAYQLDAYQNVVEAPARRSLSVHEGGGLGTRERSASSYDLAAIIRAVVAFAIATVLLGGVRIALTTQTVTLLKQVNVAESTVAEAMDTRTALKVERSALTNTDRIQRIATENYGMTYAAEVDSISISSSSQAAASADDAQSVDVADAAVPEA